MNNPMKLAVIGCGGYSWMQIRRIWAAPESAVLAAVTSRDLNSDGAVQCRDKGVPVFQTVEELLAYGQFDAVINPTPINLHTAITMQCLKAGFPVLLEKPPVATVQELDVLLEESSRAGLRVPVCFNRLFENAVQELKKDLVAGLYGKVIRVKGLGAWVRTNEYYGRSSWAGKVRFGGEWVLDGTINNPFAHVLCNNLFFAAGEHYALAEPVEVTAELYRCNDIEGEDTSCVRILTREGVEVMTWFTLGAETEIPPTTVIETEKAVITYENFRTRKIEFPDGRVETKDYGPTDISIMIRQICGAYQNGTPFCCDLDMSRAFTVAVNAAFDSSGMIHPVPESLRKQVEVGKACQMTIPGVLDVMQTAFKQNALFSEVHVPWACKGEKINTQYYNQFPVRFRKDDRRDS